MYFKNAVPSEHVTKEHLLIEINVYSKIISFDIR